MPTYEYRCPNGHVFEASIDPRAEARDVPDLRAGPIEVVLHPVAVHFKGSGFYSTDYGRGGGRRKDSGKDGDSGGGSSDGGSGDKDKTEKKDKPAEKKAAEA